MEHGHGLFLIGDGREAKAKEEHEDGVHMFLLVE
jgi:hypothetical protein